MKVEGKNLKVKLIEKGVVDNVKVKRNEGKEDLDKSGILGMEGVGFDIIYNDDDNDDDDDEWVIIVIFI